MTAEPVIPAAETFVDVDGLPTHLLTGGSGPPLLWLHGTAPAGEWLRVHSLLAEQFTVYAPAHPGFGQTERPDRFDSIEDMVLHYDSLCRVLGLSHPALAGFSLGGWLAAELAVFYPDRFRGLVILNAAGLRLDEALIPDLPTLGGEALIRTLFFDPANGLEYFAARSDPESRLRNYRALTTLALLAWNPWFDPKLRDRLRRIQAPTLVLWADQDRLIPPTYGEAYRDAIPGAQLEILPDGAHMAPLEAPDRVAPAITRFLTSLPL